MIKTKLGSLQEAVPALTALMLEKIKITQAYKVSKLATEIQPELENYIKQRDKILKDVKAVLDEKAMEYNIPKAGREIYRKAMEELYNIPVEINLDPIKLSDITESNMTSQHMHIMLTAGLLIE